LIITSPWATASGRFFQLYSAPRTREI